MAGKLTDEDAEKLVLSRGLITPERLAQFRAQAAAPPGTLFDVLVNAGVIPQQLLAELAHAAPGTLPPRPSSTASGTFLQRRAARAHVFEEPQAPLRPPSGVVAAVQPPGSAAAAPPAAPPAPVAAAPHPPSAFAPGV
ncbi:MAG: hypothetical protein NTW87_15645, partial [Planctomycetota bacterium]|nr:hypothetical protein [Planctomycetota bacterium]